MSTITAFLKPDAEGFLRVPVPAELRNQEFRVEATPSVAETKAPDSTEDRAEAVREWARHARGSVRLQPGETEDDVRMAYYRQKYGPLP